MFAPESCSATTLLTLTANNTKQSLPSGTPGLLEIVRNMGTTGTDPGAPVRVTTRELLDAHVPTWHSDPVADEIEHFVTDPRDPRTFYVYPRPSGALQVEAIVRTIPAAVTSTGATLALDDLYESALVDYVLYRAFLKDAEFAGNKARADSHYAAFTNAVAGRKAIDTATSSVSNSYYNVAAGAYGKATQKVG